MKLFWLRRGGQTIQSCGRRENTLANSKPRGRGLREGGERSLLTKMATEARSEGEVPARESGRRWAEFLVQLPRKRGRGPVVLTPFLRVRVTQQGQALCLPPMVFRALAPMGAEAPWSLPELGFSRDRAQTCWCSWDVHPECWRQTDQLVVAALPTFVLRLISMVRTLKPRAVKRIPQRHTALVENAISTF